MKNLYQELIDYEFVDLNGNPVERTPFSHPYNYDSFVNWKGDYVEGKCDAVYSDRMYSWDCKKYKEAAQEAFGNNHGLYFSETSPEDIEHFLSAYFGKSVKLTAVVQCCNQSSGFPYWCFFYQER